MSLLSLADLAQAMGLSERQVRRRIAEARPLLAGHLQTGKAGAILVDSGGLEILRRVQALTDQGVSMALAVEIIRAELTPGGNERTPGGNAPATAGVAPADWGQLIQAKDELIAVLRAQVDHLTAEVAFLRRQVDELQPRALPPPRRAWWERLLGR